MLPISSLSIHSSPPATRQRLFLRAFLLSALLLLWARIATAQTLPQAQTVFVQPHLGFSLYQGDKGVLHARRYFATELGYQLSPRWSASLAYQLARYTDKDLGLLHSAQITLRYILEPQRRFSPYVLGGSHVTYAGKSGESRRSTGPVFGFGVEKPVSDRLALFVETTSSAAFPDTAIDHKGGGVPFDLLTTVSTSVRYNIRKACPRIEALVADQPSQLHTEQWGAFHAYSNPDPSGIRYIWDFGEGTAVEGRNVAHRYVRAGTYLVTLAATNCGHTAVTRKQVVVCDPVQVVAVDVRVPPVAADSAGLLQKWVRTRYLSATLSGSPPYSYQWDFGDGTRDTTASPTHLFSKGGRYTVALQVSNCQGENQDSRLMDVDVPALEAVNFNFDEFCLCLPAQMAVLRRNAAAIKAAPYAKVVLPAYTDTVGDTTYNFNLSVARAEIVRRFYLASGIDSSRIVIQPRGEERSEEVLDCGQPDPPCPIEHESAQCQFGHSKPPPHPGECRASRRTESLLVPLDYAGIEVRGWGDYLQVGGSGFQLEKQRRKMSTYFGRWKTPEPE